jgi:hypothetical protein
MQKKKSKLNLKKLGFNFQKKTAFEATTTKCLVSSCEIHRELIMNEIERNSTKLKT